MVRPPCFLKPTIILISCALAVSTCAAWLVVCFDRADYAKYEPVFVFLFVPLLYIPFLNYLAAILLSEPGVKDAFEVLRVVREGYQQLRAYPSRPKQPSDPRHDFSPGNERTPSSSNQAVASLPKVFVVPSLPSRSLFASPSAEIKRGPQVQREVADPQPSSVAGKKRDVMTVNGGPAGIWVVVKRRKMVPGFVSRVYVQPSSA